MSIHYKNATLERMFSLWRRPAKGAVALTAVLWKQALTVLATLETATGVEQLSALHFLHYVCEAGRCSVLVGPSWRLLFDVHDGGSALTITDFIPKSHEKKRIV